MDVQELARQLEAQPAAIRSLLEDAVTTFTRWDILEALASSSEMTIETLAMYVGREPASLIPALGALVTHRLVERQQHSDETRYRLCSERRAVVEQFRGMCEEPAFRLLVIAHCAYPYIAEDGRAQNDASVGPTEATGGEM